MKLYGKMLLSMIAAGALALAALALALDWRLGHGFVDYINEIEAERMPVIATVLADHYREHRGWQQLRERPRVWRRILMQARELEDMRAAESESDDRPPPPAAMQRDRGSRGHHHADPWMPIVVRLSVFDRDGERLMGRYSYPESTRRLAIDVDGEPVGWLGLTELRQVHSPLAGRFLADQRRGLYWASIAMLVILGASAALLARTWTRPIERIAGVTRRLAGGDFSARVGRAGRDEVGDLARGIDFLAHCLAQADSARKRWMADAAHELRTPLAVLQGELEALQDGIRPLDREAIASLHAEARHLGALIDELRELAMTDVGALDYRMETLDLAELVRDCLDTNAGRLRQHPLNVTVELPQRPVPVQGDPRRLRQLLENLLENSLRYTDPGGRLEVRLDGGGDRVCLRLDDSAPGVPEASLPGLFEPFTRTDAARSRHNGGSGLGLAICRRIAQAHGGTIRAHRSALGGLTIEVEFPRGLP